MWAIKCIKNCTYNLIAANVLFAIFRKCPIEKETSQKCERDNFFVIIASYTFFCRSLRTVPRKKRLHKNTIECCFACGIKELWFGHKRIQWVILNINLRFHAQIWTLVIITCFEKPMVKMRGKHFIYYIYICILLESSENCIYIAG